MTSLLVGSFGGLLALGFPIYMVLGLTALVLFWVSGQPPIAMAQKIVDELNSQTLLAVPFFVLAATLMERGGIAQALIEAAGTWVGRVRGGLGLVCVVACMIFAAMCGSSVATAMAMGTVLVPAMLRLGYDRHFAAGVVGASGTLGILIPPSLAMVVYGVIADESVPRLFLAGVVPGILQGGLIAGWVLFYARRRGYRTETAGSPGDVWRKNLRALPAFAIPLIVLGGIYGGAATVTEAAALSALVAMLISVFVYRETPLRRLLPVLAEAMQNSAAIMIIIAMALVFGHWITESGVAPWLVTTLKGWNLEAWHFLLIVNVILLIMGMFLEVFSVLLIAMPVVVPLLKPLGIDAVHFGIVVTINMELALLTPPVGMNLFVLSTITRAPLGEVIRGTTPFILLMLLLLMAVTYIPVISLWLPRLVLG